MRRRACSACSPRTASSTCSIPTMWRGVRSRSEDTIGLAISAPATGKRFYYLPACAALDDELKARLRGAALLFFDGTLWRDDEMIRAGLGAKTGRRMGHLSVSGPDGSMEALADLGIARKLFIHINHTN